MSWLSNAKKNLFSKSEEKKFFNVAIQEFVYIDLVDNQHAEANCELCNHPNIRYEYLVRNTKNNNELIVGSECIKKFVDELNDLNIEFYDDKNNIVTKERLEYDKKRYFKRITLLLINAAWKNNMTEYRQSIISLIKTEEPLTMNQLKFLKNIYEYGEKRDIRYAISMKNTLKISLKKKKHKYQWKKLNKDEKEFVKMFLNTQQKRSLEQFDLIGY